MEDYLISPKWIMGSENNKRTTYSVARLSFPVVFDRFDTITSFESMKERKRVEAAVLGCGFALVLAREAKLPMNKPVSIDAGIIAYQNSLISNILLPVFSMDLMFILASNSFEIQLLHPEIRHLVLPSDAFKSHKGGMKRKKRNAQSKKSDIHHQATVGTVSPAAAITPTETVMSHIKAPGGGTIVSSRDENGQIHVRVEYDRDEMLRFSHSPYAVLPPVCLKNIVMSTPEILSRFPQRHGVDINPSSGMTW
ncbi:unnamed protein product [Angiostrongylus costaricensis]|uniref:UBX domain-containing protein n=1 Tax=Angiostrongylus costaricensis TaxID=334426 RepID=A0A0R3PGI4_ANGCS|nr:unnamed protein product [Angiostrongylus costaricensis]